MFCCWSNFLNLHLLIFLGNLYNAAGLHDKSANYFKQTIRLNPTWIHAWTLLGHEYIELKDLGSAVVSYRKAIGSFLLFFSLPF